MSPDDLKGYGDFMKNTLAGFSDEVMQNWTARQAYIALANGLSVTSELRVDSTPMEGFSPEGYNAKLDLTEQGYNACVILAIGYRSDEDTTQHYKKVRTPMDQLFEEL